MSKYTIASQYKGEEGRKYALGKGQDQVDHLGHRLNANLLRRHLKPTDHVLDFGCANGSLARALSQYVANVDGLEVNQYTREIAASSGLNVYSDIAGLSPDTRYDAIVSNHVLEHVPDVVGTLQRLRVHLKRGGRLVLVVPIEDFRTRRNRQWYGDDDNYHLHTWTPLLMANTLREAGYIPDEIRILTYAWTPRLFFLGDGLLQRLACFLYSFLWRKRQLIAVGRNASEQS